MKYTVNTNEFHGGHEISKYRSLRAAIYSAHTNRCIECECGGPDIYKDNKLFPEPLVALGYYRYDGLTLINAIEKAANNWDKFSNRL